MFESSTGSYVVGQGMVTTITTTISTLDSGLVLIMIAGAAVGLVVVIILVIRFKHRQ